MAEKTFAELRELYPTFTYARYEIEKIGTRVKLTFHFSIDGLCTFSPSTEIETENLHILNDPTSPDAQAIAFSLGMVELVSYWKAACPKTVKVQCGYLSDWDIRFWKRLYFRGLSEFFYINRIEADKDDFMEIVCEKAAEDRPLGAYNQSGMHIIPVGGGKDSCVTAELLRGEKEKNLFFTVNDQPARTDTVHAAGYADSAIVRTYRTIDKNLLQLNKDGFLNGHTPFSAIVAFLSFYCAYLVGARDIVLSNESSANESNIAGTEVNHQYSKSYAFECDFAKYAERNLVPDIRYFSLLRPFSELQIAKQFADYPQYHKTFRSCNRGSKQNIWCGKCAKCLFVFSILSPFMEYARLCELFGADMLDDGELLADFDGLCGFSAVKPFECVGTVSEIVFALHKTVEKFRAAGKTLPVLLQHFAETAGEYTGENLLSEYNPKNNVPDEFFAAVKEMYEYVSADC